MVLRKHLSYWSAQFFSVVFFFLLVRFSLFFIGVQTGSKFTGTNQYRPNYWIGGDGMQIQSNFNGSNTFGTMKISLRQGQFEPMRVDNGARSGDLIRISLIFYNMKVYCVLSLESPR